MPAKPFQIILLLLISGITNLTKAVSKSNTDEFIAIDALSFSLKSSLAKEPKRTMDLFFPIILKLVTKNASFDNFPDLSLPNIKPNADLSLQFYQTTTTISTNQCFAGKLYGLKMIDILSNKQQLKDIPMESILLLANSTNAYLNNRNRRCALDVIYDRKYYDTDTQYWTTIRNVCNPHVFAHFINNNFILKLQLANNPKLAKNIIFPMILLYRTKINVSLSGFPDMKLPYHSHTKDRAVLFYDILTQCISNEYFAERLYALKVIDYYDDKKQLNGVSFVDIGALLTDNIKRMHHFRDYIIMDTIYNPMYYGSTESFVSFIRALNYEFTIERDAEETGTPEGIVNKAGVEWSLAVNYWWAEAIQTRIENVVGFRVLSVLNYEMLFGKLTQENLS
eukprot:232017_1